MTKFFGVNTELFREALLISGSARGYIIGAVTELLLKQELEKLGLEVVRIREKWEGKKLHHGDYYVRQPNKDWYVVESKGLKTNSEKWHKLENVKVDPVRLRAMLEKGDAKGELQKWWKSISETRKKRILESGKFPKSRILETHFPSGTAGKAGREIATPRKSEFHMVAIDLFLRTGIHEFIYASSAELEPADGYPDHLKQNYIIDILVPGVDEKPTLRFPWSRDFLEVFNKLRKPVRERDMQIDKRAPGERQEGILDF